VFGLGVLSFIRNMGSNGLTPGKAVSIGDRQRLDLADPDWHTKTAAAVRQCFYDPQDPTTFYVTPGVPSDTAVWLDVSLKAPPKAIADGGAPGSEIYKLGGSSTTEVGVDDQYEDELYHYVVAYLLMSNSAAQGAMARASVHAQAFTTSINMLAQLATGHNPNLQRLPFAPDVPGAAS
jgi:hypothetical protein